MYSHEIDNLLQNCNHIVPVPDYVRICQSPQVNHVLREGDWCSIWTADGYHWRVSVRAPEGSE